MHKEGLVYIVVDPSFGDRLQVLAGQAVWIADTPGNRAAVTQVRASGASVTTFKVREGDSAESWCEAIVGVVDLHHGQYSQVPPYSAVQVIGASPESDLVALFAEYGLTHWRATEDGFSVNRNAG